mgnify:FL=1|tara:strand:- start:564 stop:1157 length:594 start_codon:yes stop_codon:yes gene_type:complete
MAGLMQDTGAPAQQPQPQEATANVSLDPDDPALDQAVQYLGSRLYEEDIASKIATVTEGSRESQPQMLALIAYRLAESSDATTDGDIKEENLSVIAMVALNEVMEIAEQSGMEVGPEDAAIAFRHMVTLFAQEQGLNPEQVKQLTAAMSEVDTSQLVAEMDNLPDNFADQLPDEEMPAELGADLQQPMPQGDQGMRV